MVDPLKRKGRTEKIIIENNRHYIIIMRDWATYFTFCSNCVIFSDEPIDPIFSKPMPNSHKELSVYYDYDGFRLRRDIDFL